MVFYKRALGGLAVVLFCVSLAFCEVEKVSIVAEQFYANEGKQISRLTGNVEVKKGKFDELKADVIVINLDKNRQPVRYTASGKVKFKILLNEKKYNGSCGTLTYVPATKVYTLEKDVVLNEIDAKRSVTAEKIVADQLKGVYRTENSKAPVRMNFELETKKK